jgi:Regulator of chromosome condensation (RCC1) repeat
MAPQCCAEQTATLFNYPLRSGSLISFLSLFLQVAVTEDGGLYAWGHGIHGQLGHNSRFSTQVPLLVTEFQEEGEVVIASELRQVLAPPDTMPITPRSIRAATGSQPDTGMIEHGGSQEHSNQRAEDDEFEHWLDHNFFLPAGYWAKQGAARLEAVPRGGISKVHSVHVLMAAVIVLTVIVSQIPLSSPSLSRAISVSPCTPR